MLGYPEAALADIKDALKDGREIGQAASVMFALSHVPLIHFLCGNCAAANAEANELIAQACPVLQGQRNVGARSASWPDRQSLGRSANSMTRGDALVKH